MENYWSVDDNGVLTINAELYIKEKADGVLPTASNQPWLESYNKSDITEIEFIGKGLEFPANASNWFNSYSNVTEIIGIELVSTSNVTDMYGMFAYCRNLTELNLTNFNTSNVINMNMMFYNIQNLKELDVSSFDTSNVTNMGWMFANCENLAELDVSNFDTSNVTNMVGMFHRVPNSIKTYIDTEEIEKTEKTEEKTEKTEEKTKPSYYRLKNIEVFDFIDEFELNFNIGNVAKYIARYQNKNGIEDLQKAKVYLEKEINKLKKGDCK